MSYTIMVIDDEQMISSGRSGFDHEQRQDNTAHYR